ncbi:MAG: hypothetical protein JW797_14760 [Bradymonadales bacterium]|nr:hypothetical protein [Bradymonadales bacterium]
MMQPVLPIEKVKPTSPLYRRLLSWIAMKAARLVVRLPKRLLLAGLSFLGWFLRLFKLGGPLRAVALEDVEDLIRNDPRGWDALRRMVLKCRPAQLKALIQGILTHQVNPRRTPFITAHRADRSVRGPRKPEEPFRIALVGDSYDLQRLHEIYQSSPEVQVVSCQDQSALSLAHLDGLEIGGPGPLDEELSVAALRQGLGLSLHASCLDDPRTLRRLLDAAQQLGNPIRLYHPYLFYPPVHEVKRLLAAGEIGEICGLRIRATLGTATPPQDGAPLSAIPGELLHEGNRPRSTQIDDGLTPSIHQEIGSGDPPDKKTAHSWDSRPPAERYLAHPAFDQLLLLLFFGGPVERVAAYLNPMDPLRGGQGLIACKWKNPGCFGHLEVTFAPGLWLETKHLPYDLEAEVAGSDGIIWLRRGMARRTQAAPIFVRVGRQAYSLGVESGLEAAWDCVYRHGAEQFLELLRGRLLSPIRPDDLVAALELREICYRAAQSERVLPTEATS